MVFGDAANTNFTAINSTLNDVGKDQNNYYNYNYYHVDRSRSPEDESAPAKERQAEVISEEVVNFYDIPSLQVPYFVPREALLTRLEKLFEHSNTSSRLTVVLHGMGGAGKTQLALEYCRRMKDSRKARAVFWLDASSRNALYRAMDIIATRLMPKRVSDNPDGAITLVKNTLSSWSDSWLMVFDNFDNPSDVHDIFRCFPDSRRGSILITSRHADCKQLGQVIELDRMEMDEGLQLLLRSPEEDTEELAAAKQILRRLGHLPLAIDQTHVYISKRQLPLRKFLDEFERRKQIIMRETPLVWQYRRKLPDMEKETSLSLFTTWEMSLPLHAADEQDKKNLEDVLTLLAFFHPTSIRGSLFSSYDMDADLTNSPMSIFNNWGGWDDLAFDDAVVHMEELSLLRSLRCNKGETVISFHSMVSEWLRMRLDVASRHRIFAAAVSHLVHYLDSTHHSDHSARREALLHIDAICRATEFDTESDHFVPACFTFGMFYAEESRLADAERLYECALAGYEKAFGFEHTSTLSTVYNLGALYRNQGRLEDAERMYNRALAGYENTFGSEHICTLETVNNLGILYVDQGRLDDAERMYNRALAEREKALGFEHTSTLSTVNNLGLLYADQGRLDDAERMYNRALAGREKALGPEHLSTLNTVNNLANLYANQGHFEDAESMYNRVLAGYEKTLGLEHVSILSTVNNLGNIYENQGRLVDAETMYNRVLAGREKALGPVHRSTLSTVNNLGALYQEQGLLVEAEKMFDRALAGRKKALGSEHISTLSTVSNLGSLYADQGRLEDAQRMYNRALVGKEKALGSKHTSTLITANNLGLLYATQGRLADAKKMYDRALAGFEEALGSEHSLTLQVMQNLTDLHNSQRRPENAEAT